MDKMKSEDPRFWDRFAAKYSRQPVADQAAYETKLRKTREYFRPDMKLLEFGCGTGSTAISHAPHVAHIHAIDVSANMLAIAREKAAAANISNITFEQATMESFEAPAASFDAVLGLSILHLLEDYDGAIAKVHRLLKPGGVFVSNTVCIADMNPVFGIILPLMRLLGRAPFVNIFTRNDLVRSLESGGFRIVHEWQPKKGVVFIIAEKVEA